MTSNLTEFLYRALQTPTGIVVKTSNVELLRNRLYATRREAQNIEFEVLTFMPSRTTPKTELWIARKGTP